MLLSLDCEATGIDLFHGVKPFLVTTASDEGQIFWEWDVDPLTREPQIPYGDVEEVQALLDSADEIVLQNAKYDFTALRNVGIRLDWEKVRDTLLAGHILATNVDHDLYSMAVQYLGVDCSKFEDEMKASVNECRRLARSEYAGKILRVTQDGIIQQPLWMIAAEGLPCMPSAKGGSKKGTKGVESESPWKADCWLPRVVAREKNLRLADCEVAAEGEDFDLDISTGRWKCLFIPGGHHTEESATQRYRDWVVLQPDLMRRVSDLDGRRLGGEGVFHGHVLREILRRKCSHKYWFVTADYANADSALTLPLWRKMKSELEHRGLWKIYLSRLPLLPIAAEMEERGPTVSRTELFRVRDRYQVDVERAERICLGIAADLGDHDLLLPNGSSNDSLTRFIFGRELVKERQADGKIRVRLGAERPGLGLRPAKYTESGAPSYDKDVLEEWENTLEQGSLAQHFVEALRERSGKNTGITYLNGYERYWLPLGIFNDAGEQLWYRLHPALNPTGTNTLRWSSSNPNEQNISKKESECPRCKGEGCRQCDGTGIGSWSLRRCFGPAPGREWWSLDAQNIELRIPAYEAGETDLVAVFDEPNKPPYFGSYHLVVFDALHPEKFAEHGAECKTIYEATEYQWVKNGNFCRQYGAQERKTDATFRVKGAYKMLSQRFPNIDRLNRQYLHQANKYGYVETIPDRTVDPERGYPILCSRSESGGIVPTTPFCYHVSGSACWWMGRAMTKCQPQIQDWRRTGFDAYMTLQVHDELVFDMPKRAHPKKNPKESNLGRIRVLQRLMESCGADISVPTPVSVEYHDTSWAKSVKL